jgi:prepilin-type N-terminal cleavage/methylation domain-containing protein
MSKKQIAFTLIELLVVIAIIGILSGLIIVGMNGMTQKATIAKLQVFSNSLKNSLLMNLVSEWKFDGTTADGGTIVASDVLDTWSSINNGVVTATPPIVKTGSICVVGSCLSFDGIDDYVDIAGSNVSTSNLAITGAITLSAWTKFNVLGTSTTIIGRGVAFTGDANYGYCLSKLGATNKIYFDIYSTTTRFYISSGSVAIGNADWHYIVATWDGTTSTNRFKIYIDGALAAQGTSTISTIGQPNYYFRIGRDGIGQYPFNGLIDEVRVYNATVPTSQIKEQYYSGLNKLLANSGIDVKEYQKRLAEIDSFAYSK